MNKDKAENTADTTAFRLTNLKKESPNSEIILNLDFFFLNSELNST